MKKVVFMALATVFMLSSGFSSLNNVKDVSLTDNSPHFNKLDNLETEDFGNKICRFRFVNEEGETIDVHDYMVDESVDCSTLRPYAEIEHGLH